MKKQKFVRVIKWGKSSEMINPIVLLMSLLIWTSYLRGTEEDWLFILIMNIILIIGTIFVGLTDKEVYWEKVK